MGDVVEGRFITKLDLPIDKVLAGAAEAELEEVIVIGFTKGGEFWFSGSKADGGASLWLLAMAQKKLLEIGDPEHDG